MANETSGGGKPLGAIARAFISLRSALYKPPPNTIDNVNPQAWPSALNPVQPTGPKGSQPLAFSFWQGINLEITPRADLPLTFAQLRDLATYPLARMCIENVKDILSTLPRKIQLKRNVGEELGDWKKRQASDKTIPVLTDFFEMPDGETPWSDWIRPILEDLLVIDAPCALVQRSLSGKVMGLRWSDGSQFLRLINDQGFTPQGDNPAYTQLWEGIPRLLLTTRQLVYRPSNIVARNSYASKIYGMSITEQLAQEIAIGQQRLNFVLAYYKDGIDGAVRHIVPAGVTPDKVIENEQAYNSVMMGNLAKRRGMKSIQGYHGVQDDKPDQFLETKEPVLADVFDDVHIKKVTFGYGVSSQRLTKMLNRAGAEAGQDAAEKEGIMPRLNWLRGFVNHIIQVQMGQPNYEMVFDTDDELDAVKQETVDTNYIKGGVKAIDEVRIDRGWVPFGIPETKVPIIITATGVQPLEGSFDRVDQQLANDTTTANKPTPASVVPHGPVGGAGKKALSAGANTRY
jgi:hypothetical protein